MVRLRAFACGALYSEPSVRAYERESVQVALLGSDQVIEVDCYNLPLDLALAGANPTYASKLARLAESLELDSAYVQEVERFAEEP